MKTILRQNVEGKVTQINIKPYQKFIEEKNETGLPKYPVESIEVKLTGVGEDYNHYRTTDKRSTPNRAVLIYTEDMIEQLNSEGWPLKAGDIGENFLVTGLSYDFFEVGKQYKIGEVIIEITEKCHPCRNLGHLSYVGDKVDDFIKTMRNRRGWYGKVITIGTVSTGDRVTKHI